METVSVGNAVNLISRKWFAVSCGNQPKPPQLAASFNLNQACNVGYGTKQTSLDVRSLVAIGGKRTWRLRAPTSEIDPQQTFRSIALCSAVALSGDPEYRRTAQKQL